MRYVAPITRLRIVCFITNGPSLHSLRKKFRRCYGRKHSPLLGLIPTLLTGHPLASESCESDMTYTATTPTSPIAATIANNTNVVVINSMTSSVRARNEEVPFESVRLGLGVVNPFSISNLLHSEVLTKALHHCL
jgi:hypothetical protein